MCLSVVGFASGIAMQILDSKAGMSWLSLFPKPHPQKQSRAIFHFIKLITVIPFSSSKKALRYSLFNCCLLPRLFLFLLILLLNLCYFYSISLLCSKAELLEDGICFCLSPTTSSYSILLPITFALHLHFYFKWFKIPIYFCSLLFKLRFFL